MVFVVAGLTGLAGMAGSIQLFDHVGLGQWLRYCSGLLALSGGILLLIPSGAIAGSAIATVVTLGALLLQMFMEAASTVPALLLALLSGVSLVQAQLDQPVATRRR